MPPKSVPVVYEDGALVPTDKEVKLLFAAMSSYEDRIKFDWVALAPKIGIANARHVSGAFLAMGRRHKWAAYDDNKAEADKVEAPKKSKRKAAAAPKEAQETSSKKVATGTAKKPATRKVTSSAASKKALEDIESQLEVLEAATVEEGGTEEEEAEAFEVQSPIIKQEDTEDDEEVA